MVEGRFRSRKAFRRVHVIVPGNTSKIHFRPRKPKLGSCSVTGEKLKGVPREKPKKMQNMSKTSKRPSRPFGGVLSSRAMRTNLKARARKL